MKKRIAIFGAMLIVVVVATYGCRQRFGYALRASVEKTRRELRQQNFKTDLSDFNFTLPKDIAARANAITNAGEVLQAMQYANELQLMQAVGTNVALAVSQIEIVQTYHATNVWPLIKEELGKNEKQFDLICASLLSGPLKFAPTIRSDGEILLPYVASYRNVARVLAIRATLAMHEHDTNAMFTNIFALSRMVTAWTPEPIEISHLIRFSTVRIAQQVIWESMQTDLWTELQLAALQKEWESARFFDGLPETTALTCLNVVASCRAARDRSYSANMGGWGAVFRNIFYSPGNSIQNMNGSIKSYSEFAKYRNYGSYEDERAAMFYYRDRKEELKRAITCLTWSEMRAFPSATNVVPFQGAKNSRVNVMTNLRQISTGFQGPGSGQGQIRTLLSRAAEAEAERRVIVTAIALERFATEHKKYPKILSELVPAYLSVVPVDFMDGNELRYWWFDDGRYLLYSIGLDCVDNDGQMRTAPTGFGRGTLWPTGFRPRNSLDIVWPLRAKQTDIDLFEQQQKTFQE